MKPDKDFKIVTRRGGTGPARKCRKCHSKRVHETKWARLGVDVTAVPKACEACGSTDRLNIDHDHATNEYRGVLCSPCNVALGLLADSTERIKALYKYAKARC